ncbi:MAG: hypothetical protein Q7U16_20335 [Agitococcus sp.]|nr:hypothetical protein [Agitococcus sp.]
MKKIDFLKECEQHQVNPKALKRKMNEDDISRKDASRYDVLKCMMIHCTDLMFCRQSDYENEVEYADKHAPSRLIDAMLEAQKEAEQ